MRIWIFNAYGNIPGESWSPYRSTMLAEALAARGHQVVWWISNFEHRSKRFRCEGWKDVVVSPGYLIRIVPTTSYTRHISLARIMAERTYARNLVTRARAITEQPDVIIHGEPALFLAGILIEAVRFSGARLVVDILDLWPELFAIKLPQRLRWLQACLFWPLYLRRSWFLRQADGFIAASSDYLKLASWIAPRTPGRVIYWGVDISMFNAVATRGIKCDSKLLPYKEPGDTWVIYAGTLGENYDIKTILDCAIEIQRQGLPIVILIAGDGPLRQTVLETMAVKRLKRVRYLGRIEQSLLLQVYAKCDIALSCYVGASTVSMPIKAYDYLAAGLPLVNSLGRDLGAFVRNRKVGVQYTAENPDEMLSAIKLLSIDVALRAEYAKNAIKLALEFDIERQYGSAADFIESVYVGTTGRGGSTCDTRVTHDDAEQA